MLGSSCLATSSLWIPSPLLPTSNKPRLRPVISAFQTLTADGQSTMLTGTGNALAVFLSIGVAVIIYAVLILLTRAISKSDLELMPKGEKIARLLHLK